MAATHVDKIKAIAKHYKIERKSQEPWNDLLGRIRAAHNVSKMKTITEWYDELYPPKDTKLIEATATDVTPVETVKEPVKQAMEISGPSMTFNLVPQTLQFEPSNLSRAYMVQRSAMHAFVFASGVAFGMLAKLLGVV